MESQKWRLDTGEVHASVRSYKGVTKVHLRNFKLVEPGEWIPTVKGVTLSWGEWEHLKSLVQTIDLEFRKRLSQRVETRVSQPPQSHGFGEIPTTSSFGGVQPSFERPN